MKDLITDLKSDVTHASLKKPLINQFAKHDLIPNKWFDWERRQNRDHPQLPSSSICESADHARTLAETLGLLWRW